MKLMSLLLCLVTTLPLHRPTGISLHEQGLKGRVQSVKTTYYCYSGLTIAFTYGYLQRFDAQGNEIARYKYINDTATHFDTTTYRIDASGSSIEHKATQAGLIKDDTKLIAYNQAGDIISKASFWMSSEDFVYNENGMLLKESHRLHEGDWGTVYDSVVLDNNKNWIRRRCISDADTAMAVREISCY